jgi:hypothetical protein
MPLTATATLICDECNDEVTADLENDSTADDAVDQEGWVWSTEMRGRITRRLLCEECAEAELDA